MIYEIVDVFCGNPGQLQNGSLEGTNFSYNDQVHYKCNKEYKLVGNSNRTCLESGNLSGSLPNCIPNCIGTCI